MTELNVAVLGVGANGGSLAADFIRSGVPVTLIDQWPANVEAIRATGLRVQTPAEEFSVKADALHLCQLAEIKPAFDVVFLVVKAYDTQWACELIRPYLKPDGVVVGVQNGMTIDTMSPVLGTSRVVGCVIEIAAAMYTPGLVERHTPSDGTWFAVGGLDAIANRRLPDVTGMLETTGTVTTTDDIRSAKWMKLVVNSAELVTSAILDLPLLEAARVPGMHQFMVRAGQEAMRAALSAGQTPVSIIGLDPADASDPDLLVERMLDAVYSRWSLPHTRTTVLQDWDKGRRSEVDQLNGHVVAQMRAARLPATANERIVALAHEIEAGTLERAPANADQLAAVLSSRDRVSGK